MKDSKIMMRNYLSSQINEKKEVNKISKRIESEQVDIWNKENYFHSQKKNELDEKVNLKL